MKKIVFTIFLFYGHYGFAQQSIGNYILKVESAQPYTELTTGTNITSSLVWDDENFKFPMGFSVNLDGKTTSDFSFSASEGFGPGSDTMGIVNTFSNFAGGDLIDRGFFTGTPKSPLRYVTSGSSPNRIFKFEVSNAGFYEESDLYSSLKDSVSFQIWVYETTGIIEFRYGTSQISHPTDYFFLGGSPLIGYAVDFDLDASTFTKAYTLVGNPNAPTVDSFSDFSTLPTVMDAYPSNGTVYRFIPKTVAASIGESTITTKFRIYPTFTKDNITVIAENVTTTSGKVIDMNGKIITGLPKIEQGRNTFDVSNLAAGNYMLEIFNSEGRAVYRFTKQ